MNEIPTGSATSAQGTAPRPPAAPARAAVRALDLAAEKVVREAGAEQDHDEARRPPRVEDGAPGERAPVAPAGGGEVVERQERRQEDRQEDERREDHRG